MPRLCTNRYLDQHTFLRKACLDFPYLFSNLSSFQQRVLYDFYLPHRDLTPPGLQAHRAEVSAVRPHLPARAGKIFNHVYAVFCRAFELAAGDETRFYAELRKLTASQSRASKVYTAQGAVARRISVYPRLRPEPDVDRLVHALLRLAEDMRKSVEYEVPPQDPPRSHGDRSLTS